MSRPAASAAPGPPAQVLETKVVILGHTGVGKTSMLTQFVRGDFPLHTAATIGAAFMRKTIKLQGWQVVLQIWDTAGQERFRSMAPLYFRGAQAAVLVYDVTQPNTLEKVHSWVEELAANATTEQQSEPGIVLMLAGNKNDLIPPGDPAAAELMESSARFADSIGAPVFQTSAKTGAGLTTLFEDLARRLLERHLQAIKDNQALYRGHEPMPKPRKQQGGCC